MKKSQNMLVWPSIFAQFDEALVQGTAMLKTPVGRVSQISPGVINWASESERLRVSH